VLCKRILTTQSMLNMVTHSWFRELMKLLAICLLIIRVNHVGTEYNCVIHVGNVGIVSGSLEFSVREQISA